MAVAGHRASVGLVLGKHSMPEKIPGKHRHSDRITIQDKRDPLDVGQKCVKIDRNQIERALQQHKKD
jgi:hypothetical protein